MLEGKKGHFLIIFDKLLSVTIVPIIVIVVALTRGGLAGDTGQLLSNLTQFLPLLIIALVGPIQAVLKYVFTTYQVTDKMFIVKSGVINKEKLEIPLETITTIDFTQNILFQICKVNKIRIETTVQYAGKKDPNTVLALKEEDAIEFKQLLLSKKQAKLNMMQGISTEQNFADGGVQNANSNEAVENTSYGDFANYQVTPEVVLEEIKPNLSRLIMLGLIGPKSFIVIQLIAFAGAIGGFIGVFFENMEEEIVNGIASGLEMNSIERLIVDITESNFFVGIIVLAILVTVLIAFVFLIILSAIATVIRYFDFTIKKTDKNIQINYGLLNKKKFTLTDEKVSGVALEQSLVMRFLGYYRLNVYAIGYGGGGGDESAEVVMPILYPIGKKDEVLSVLNTIMPDIKQEEEFYREKKGTLRYFFYRAEVVFSLLLIAAWPILAFTQEAEVAREVIGVFGILFLLMALTNSILSYHNAKLSLGENTLSYIKGGFNRSIIMLKTNLIETVSYNTTYLKEKRNLGHIIVQFYGPLHYSKGKVVNMRKLDFEKVRNLIKL